MKKKFCCKKCNFYTDDKYNFDRHRQTSKHKSKQYYCMFCKKNYKYQSGLSRHINKFHQKEMYELNKEEEYGEEDNVVVELIPKQQQSNNKEVKELLEIIRTQQKQLDQSPIL